MSNPSPHVGLFVTCLVNLFRPSVGFASIQLLEAAGCQVSIPDAQTCCGQPGYNPGDFAATRDVAKLVITLFSDFDYVVAPSGSCASMLREHYPKLLSDDKAWRIKAENLANKTWELTSFLTDVCHFTPTAFTYDYGAETFTYHDSCAGLRELNIKQQPRQLLSSLCNAKVSELENREECCGFGGTFCAKMPTISSAMVNDKITAAEKTQATTLLGGDMGCLLNIAGAATRTGSRLQVRHIAEVLAGQLHSPAIGQAQEHDGAD